MHAVDIFDQIRKMFGVDLTNATKKWTVRIFEILWSMVLAQAYNIHRVMFATDPDNLMSHTDFKAAVVMGILQDPVVQPPLNAAAVTGGHCLLIFPEGSRGDGSSRRKVVECRHCPYRHADDNQRNKMRQTSYYCPKCRVGFHPICHTQFHGNFCLAASTGG